MELLTRAQAIKLDLPKYFTGKPCKYVCGLHCWANLQLLDKSANGSKHDTYQAD